MAKSARRVIGNHLPPRRASPTLEPFYYLKNFEKVLAKLLDRYADLLDEEELRFIVAFQQTPLSSRALLVRMVMRRGDLFKASRLNYPEIGDTRASAEPLIEAQWVTPDSALTIEQLRRLFTKAEMSRLMGLPRRCARGSKDDLVRWLMAQSAGAKPFADWFVESPDVVYQLRIEPMCERFRLMYFGNYRQSWTDFVTADLKIFQFEKIDESMQCRPFETRAQVLLCEQLQRCRQLLEEGASLDGVVKMMPGPVFDNDWIDDRRQKLLFRIARQYERTGGMPQALSLYATCTYRGARTRFIRLASRAQDWEAARTACVAAQEQPESEAELQFVKRTLPKIFGKLKIACQCGPAAPSIPEFEVILDGPGSAGAVEYWVRDHLAGGLEDPNTVQYVENGLINALFGLLCWPAIFAPVPGAFFHDFHHGPVDLNSTFFFRRRQREFEACLSELGSLQYLESIWRNFESKRGIQSPFVRWSAIDQLLLQWALHCFPAQHLKLWFEWILRDVHENRAGFPDLVQFWPDECKYRLIEVKGPGDRVQDNQRRLLEYCLSHGMPVAVCHARWRA